MANTLVHEPHLALDAQGRACIKGTPYRVLDVVIDHVIHGFSPAEIQYQHYQELSLAQIHAALSYYYDHRDMLDKALAKDSAEVEALRPPGESPLVKRLRAEGRWP